MLEQIGFGVVALALLFAGFKVVSSKNLVHTVLWLGVTLAATAVLFILLDAPFLAAIQIILYTGGVLTLMLFGVMLTHRDVGFTGIQNPSHRRAAGFLLAGSVAAMLGGAIARTDLPASPAAASPSTRELGVALFTDHVLAFEVLSLLLLGAVLGAIVLARKRDAGDEQDAPVIKRRAPPVRVVTTAGDADELGGPS